MMVKSKNVPRTITFNRYLYAVLEDVADSKSLKVSQLVNEELTKLFEDKVQYLKQLESKKYT